MQKRDLRREERPILQMGLEVKDKEGFASTLKRSDPKAKRSSIKE